jgi:WhiB family redox-sensing transcriptional regulator
MKVDTRLRINYAGRLANERDEDWRAEAACQEVDPELFFPVSVTGPGRIQVREAKNVCATCPVIQDCLKWALESTPMPFGIWGGTTEEERARMPRLATRRYFRKEWR